MDDESPLTVEQLDYILRCKRAIESAGQKISPETLDLMREIVDNLENGHSVFAVILAENLTLPREKLDELRRVFGVKRVV